MITCISDRTIPILTTLSLSHPFSIPSTPLDTPLNSLDLLSILVLISSIHNDFNSPIYSYPPSSLSPWLRPFPHSQPIIVLLLLPLVPPPSPFDSSSFPTICSEVEEPSRYGDLSLSLLPPPLSPTSPPALSSPREHLSSALSSISEFSHSFTAYLLISWCRSVSRKSPLSFFLHFPYKSITLSQGDTVNNPNRLIPNFPSWRSIESRKRSNFTITSFLSKTKSAETLSLKASSSRADSIDYRILIVSMIPYPDYSIYFREGYGSSF